MLGGIDWNKKSEINEIICTDIKYYVELWRKRDLLLRIAYGKPCQYQVTKEEREIFERFDVLESNFSLCIINKNKFIQDLSYKDVDCFNLQSLEEIQGDFNDYYKKDDPIKKDEFKKIVVELKKLHPDRYKHISESFLTNKKSFKNTKDFLKKFATLLQKKISNQGETLNTSEAVECCALALNINIKNCNENPSYNSQGKIAPHGFSYSTVYKTMGTTFTSPETQGNITKEAKKVREEKIKKIEPCLKDVEFDQHREYVELLLKSNK
jgi:hypothetical protein